MEQLVLRAEARSALGLQGRQELWARSDVSRRGPPAPRQRHLGGPRHLQEEEARRQTTVGSHFPVFPQLSRYLKGAV